MIEKHIQVSRTARYYQLGQPGPHIADIWVVCHGFAQLASRFLSRFKHIASDSRLIVAPEALNRFYIDTSPRPHGPDAVVGATWMTREDRQQEIADYVRYLDAVYREVKEECRGSQHSLTVLGFSQGVATACRWFTHGHAIVQRLVLWSGHIPGDLPIEEHSDRWSAADLVLVWGDSDARVHGAAIARDNARLAQIDVAPRSFSFVGGHELNHEALGRLAANG
jgi:dienelactone hydrolase